MQNKVKIKVIKKDSVKTHKTPEATQENKVKDEKQQGMREVVATVSDWINDFQQRREETKQSFDRLFLKIDKPSSM
jgi:hypothetical protein